VSSVNASLVRVPRLAFGGIAVLLLGLTLVYPDFGTRARIHERIDGSTGTGNNGLAYLENDKLYVNKDPNTGLGGEHNLRYTADAVNWVRQNIKGSPTTIE